jgi:F-type H+-transporting ATPase subunit a
LLLHGDSLLLNVSGVFSLLFSIVMTFFELLIQFLQAFIFTILAALYISDAVAEEH